MAWVIGPKKKKKNPYFFLKVLHGGETVGNRAPMNMGMDTHVYDGYAWALATDDMCAWVYEVDFIRDYIHTDMCNRLG